MVKNAVSSPSVLHTSLSFMYFPVTVFLYPDGERFAPGEAEALMEMARGFCERPNTYWHDALMKVFVNHYAEHCKIRPDAPLAPGEFRDSFHPEALHIWPDGSWGITLTATPYALSRIQLLAKFSADGTSYTQKVGQAKPFDFSRS